jgi:hypothetical protein
MPVAPGARRATRGYSWPSGSSENGSTDTRRLGVFGIRLNRIRGEALRDSIDREFAAMGTVAKSPKLAPQ